MTMPQKIAVNCFMIAIGFSLLIPGAFTAVTISQQSVSDGSSSC